MLFCWSKKKKMSKKAYLCLFLLFLPLTQHLQVATSSRILETDLFTNLSEKRTVIPRPGRHGKPIRPYPGCKRNCLP